MESQMPPPPPAGLHLDPLELFLPGYSYVTRLMLHLFSVDISKYIPLILMVGVLYTGGRYVLDNIYSLLWTHITSTAEIDISDDVYNYLAYWLANQPFSNNTNSFVASSDASTYGYNTDSDDDGSDCGGDYGDGDDMQADESFDEYWARTNRRDKVKKLFYTPSASGFHYFWYKNRCFRINKVREKGRMWTERIHLSVLGRNPRLLKDVLEEAQRGYLERESQTTVIHQAVCFPEARWVRSMARHPRPLSTVILDKEQKDGFLGDVKDYLHPFTRRWYSNRGIPYRRGYLFTGPPGCGKTSLCFAAAGKLGLKIYVISLNSRQLTEEGLSLLFSKLPRRCIVLLEDIDTAGITHTRSSNAPALSDEGNKDAKDDAKPSAGNGEDETDPQGRAGISLSALLNTIDGIASTEGRILIMTTNHVENLDPALLRPGRVDLTIAFDFATTQTIIDLFRAIYTEMDADGPQSRGRLAGKSTPTTNKASPSPTQSRSHILHHSCSPEEIVSLASEFAAIVPAGKVTPAQIQGYLLKHKDTPRDAVRGAAEWVVETEKSAALSKTLKAPSESSERSDAKTLIQASDDGEEDTEEEES